MSASVRSNCTLSPGKTMTRDFTYDVEVFFDGACPLCRREIAMLSRWDRKGRIRFTDIAAPGFDAPALGWTQAELMAEIHGRLPDGTSIKGVEVFRRLYSAVGFGPLVWLTRLPGLSHLLDAGYSMFARHRLKLTGRCSAESCALEVPVDSSAAPRPEPVAPLSERAKT